MYCNGILSHTWSYVREAAGLGVWVVVGEAWQGTEDIISFSPNFPKYSICSKYYIWWH